MGTGLRRKGPVSDTDAGLGKIFGTRASRVLARLQPDFLVDTTVAEIPVNLRNCLSIPGNPREEVSVTARGRKVSERQQAGVFADFQAVRR